MSGQEILAEIRERIVRVETKIDSINDVQKTADNARDTANEALTSSRSAHKRLNKIDKAIFWLVTAIIGGVITAVLSLIIGG